MSAVVKQSQSGTVDLLKTITKPTDAAVELRAMSNGRVTGRCFARTVREITSFVNDYSTCNLYFGVAARQPEAYDGSISSCRYLACLFVDLDFKLTGPQAAETALNSFALAPSVVIESGGGLHPYWLLSQSFALPAEAERAKALLRKLAIKLGADLAAAEPARILRIPSTLNYKYSPPRPVKLLSFEGHSYRVEQFEQLLTQVTDVGAGGGVSSLLRRSAPFYFARLDFSRIAAGIPDGERDVQLFRLACSLRRRGYNQTQAVRVVLDAASRCNPPFPARLAERKVASAWRYR
jgi:hypothetical protein